jgi:hypothetical protein
VPIGGNITGGGGGGDASSWTERYAVDFSTQGAHNFDTGSIVIDGVTWDVDNEPNSSMTEMTAGSGLQIATDGTHDTQLYVAPRQPPRVWASIAGSGGIYPSMGSSQSFAVQAIIEPTVELSADYDEWGIILSTASLDTSFAASLREYSSGAFSGIGPYLFRLLDGGATQGAVAGTTEASPHTFFEVAYLKGGTCVASSSADSDFVDPLTATTFQAFISPNQAATSTASAVTFKVTDMRFQIYLTNNFTGTSSFRLTCTKFRLLTLGS